jgi:protein dithiol oxidoreductase (disulfide-forming)
MGDTMRSHVPFWAALLLIASTNTTFSAGLVEGRDYEKAPNAAADRSAASIEVIEFFSYGCRGCYAFQPWITSWKRKLPSDVTFMRLPVSLGYPSWKPLSFAYYALETIGERERLDEALFTAIHKQRQSLKDPESLAAWVGAQGGDAKAFLTAYHSPAVAGQVAHAEEVARGLKIDRTPRLVIEKQYVVIGKAAKGFEDWLAIADQLIAQAR